VLKRKKVAVISDTTGYGTASVNAYVPMLKGMAPTSSIRQRRRRQSDLKPELLRMQSADGSDHALERECRLPVAHHQYRGQMGWTCQSSARPRSAPARPSPAGKAGILAKVYPTISGRFATPRAASFRSHQRFRRPPEERQDRHGDTLLWWIGLATTRRE